MIRHTVLIYTKFMNWDRFCIILEKISFGG